MSNILNFQYFKSVFNNKCPRCRKGDLFKTKSAYNLKNILEMNENCSVCNQKTEIEPGFYYGTSYVSYVLAVAFVVAVFIAWYVIIGFSMNDNKVFGCMGTAIVGLIAMQPFLMRLSRSLWLSWFVKYNKNWNTVANETSS